MFKKKGRLIWILIAVIAVAIVAVTVMQGGGVTAERAVAERTGLESTVRGEGRTRVVDRFLFTAPLGGQLLRLDAVPGDSVKAGDVLFRIEPGQDSEQGQQVAEARLQAARASESRLERLRDDAVAVAAQADRTLERQEALATQNILSEQEIEQARLAAASAHRQVDAAEAALRTAAAEVRTAEALYVTDDVDRAASGIAIRAHEDGVILRIPDRSARMVMAGEPILETGNLSRMEVVVDVLSEDAVQVRPGNPVRLSGSGQEGTLDGHVRYVEPAAFTKLSALGVEEQRVNVVIALDGEAEGLGDGYRVDADIVVWRSDNALTVPVSSIFRQEGRWYVFAIVADRVERREVELGRRSDERAEILGGLSEGDDVVHYPTSEIEEGVELNH